MNNNAKETIRAKLPIESVVGSYVKLEKNGKNFRACCPFHNEKTPSFYVTPDRGIYYCYGCHKGGDIFKFVEEIEGVPFIDALKTLAEKAGVSLEMNSGEKPSRVSILREIMDEATKHYEVGLRTTKPVVDYLMGRGMTKDTMVAWRIGYAQQGWSGLYDFLKRKYSDEDILATGLCLQGKQQGLYDRFRERIMFPITDAQGRVIAFTGRVMPGTEEATRPVGKYINSPETDLYHKSAVLFGFDKAKTSVHSENFIILVEGQMDAIMSHQSGVTNVAALSGTASTSEHMKQIGRFTNHVAICLDADAAGLAAATKTAMVAYAHDMKVLVIDVSGGKDPADLIKDHPDEWKNIIKHRKEFVTFRLEKMKQNGQMSQKVEISGKEIFPILMYIHSEIELDEKLREIAHAFGMTSVEPVRAEFQKFMRTKSLETPTQDPKPIVVGRDQRQSLRERMLAIMLLLESFEPYNKIRSEFEKIVGSFEELKSHVSEQSQKELMFQAENELGALPEKIIGYERAFLDALHRYEKIDIEEKLKRLKDALHADPDNTERYQREEHSLMIRRDEITRMFR